MGTHKHHLISSSLKHISLLIQIRGPQILLSATRKNCSKFFSDPNISQSGAYNFVANTLQSNIIFRLVLTAAIFLHKIVWNLAYKNSKWLHLFCLMRMTMTNFICKFKSFLGPEWKASRPKLLRGWSEDL